MNMDKNKEIGKKISWVDVITALLCAKLGWTWDNEQNGVVNADKEFVEWEDFDSVPIDTDNLVQANIWGDGTIELQGEDGESVNVYDFEVEVLERVAKCLGF